MRESLNNFRLRAGRRFIAFLDLITFGRGGKPTGFEAAHARAARIGDQIIFWMPFLVVVLATLPSDSLFPSPFPNMVVMIIGFYSIFQTKLYRIQLDATHHFAKEYIASLEERRNTIIINHTLEQINTSLLADNFFLMQENARLGGHTRPSGPTPPFGGMTH